MTLNEILTRQNLITKLILATDSKELTKELKVKIMRIRRAYTNIRKEFDKDVEEFRTEIVSEELQTLANNENRTETEEARFNELNTKANNEYQEYLIQKGNEQVKDVDDKFSETEYEDILDLNVNNDVTINGQKISGTDLMEVFYDIFVNTDTKMD